jgi:hypothetical protein
MPYYKVPDSKSPHFLESENDIHFLPEGSTLISDADALEMLPKADPKQAIKDQIAALESQITPRRIRDFAVSGDATFIKGIDAQIAKLRGELA